jgi:hypothetical protein
MKMAGIREIREKTADYLGGKEPFFVLKHGKVAGVYVPLAAPESLPDDWRREIAGVLGPTIARLLDAAHISEKQVQAEFHDFRRGRRGR